MFSIFNGPKPLVVPDSNVLQNIYPATPHTVGGQEKETLFYHPQSGGSGQEGSKSSLNFGEWIRYFYCFEKYWDSTTPKNRRYLTTPRLLKV